MKGKKTDMKKILVVAAHPDDEILGVGATVAKHAAQGDEVYALILGEGQTSRGEHREDISADVVKELHQNTLESAEKVGYKEVYFADFPDNRFDQVDLLDVVKAVEHKIKEIQPEIIYALQRRSEHRSSVYRKGGVDSHQTDRGLPCKGNLRL